MPSVGGEDRLEAALGSGDRLGLIAVEGAKEELRLVLLLEGLLPGKRREDDQPSVRGEGEGLSIHREVVALRQPDLHAVYWRVLRNCPSADSLRDEGPRESAQDCESSDSTYSIGHGEASPAPLAGPGPRRGPPGLASLGQVETAHPDVAGEVGRRAYRPRGSFARSRSLIHRTGAGVRGASLSSGSGSSRMMAVSVSAAEAPPKGRFPVSIS